MKLIYSIVKDKFSQISSTANDNNLEFEFTLCKLSNYFAHKIKDVNCTLFHEVDADKDKGVNFFFDEEVYVPDIIDNKLLSDKRIDDLQIKDAIYFLYAISVQNDKFLYAQPGTLLLEQNNLFNNNNSNIVPFKFGLPTQYISKMINIVGINPPEVLEDKNLDSYDLSFIVVNDWESAKKTAQYLLNFIEKNLETFTELIISNNDDLLMKGKAKYFIDFNFIIKNVWFPCLLKKFSASFSSMINDDDFFNLCDEFLINELSSGEDFHINKDYIDGLFAVKRTLLTQNTFSKGIVSQRFFDNVEENIIASLCDSFSQ